MQLPEDFEFSQSCLQDYADCARRFWLKYVEERVWPAEITRPAIEHEIRMLAGQSFHTLVQQHLNGIPAERLTPYVQGEELEHWWSSYLAASPADLPGQQHIEFTLAARVVGFRLVAKYDLLVVASDGSVSILDWKTSRRKPYRDRLAIHAQTRVYPFLVVRAGSQLMGVKQVSPERIRMLYWFVEAPTQPEIFDYSSELYRRDEAYLAYQIEQIAGAQGAEDFAQTMNARACEPCVYRSYCLRGGAAPLIDTLDEEPSTESGTDEFNLDTAPEVAY